MTSSEGFQTGEVESQTERMGLLRVLETPHAGAGRPGPLPRAGASPSAGPGPAGGGRGAPAPQPRTAASRGAAPATPPGDFFAFKVHEGTGSCPDL